MDDLQSVPVVGDDQRYVKNGTAATPAEEDQVAGPGVIYRDLSSLVFLGAGTGREVDVEIIHYIVGEARAIEALPGRASRIFVAGTQLLLGVVDNIRPEQHLLAGYIRAGSGC